MDSKWEICLSVCLPFKSMRQIKLRILKPALKKFCFNVKNGYLGETFGQVRELVSHSREPGSSFQLVRALGGSRWELRQPPAPTWETWVEFPAHGSSGEPMGDLCVSALHINTSFKSPWSYKTQTHTYLESPCIFIVSLQHCNC